VACALQHLINVRGEQATKFTEQVLVTGTTAEAIGGFAAAVLAIVGLLSGWSYTFCGIAAIAAGVGLLAHGVAITSRWREVMSRLDPNRYDRGEIGGGIAFEVMGGLASIVLGVLAVAGIAPFVMLPAAVIVFGVTLLLGGATQPGLVELSPERDPRFAKLTHDASFASGGVMVLVGIAAAVLGLLAFIGVGTIITLSLIAMLCVGVALFLAGSALSARFVHRFA
jgi:hypothetical protein